MANISHFTQTVNGVSTTYDIHDADAIPRNGGAVMTGASFARTNNSSFLELCGGTSFSNGASFVARGKDFSGEQGVLYLYSRDGTYTTEVKITPLGEFRLVSTYLDDGIKNVAYKEDTVPRSGGAVMTGSALGRNIDNEEFDIRGGRGDDSGTIRLYGKDYTGYSLAGCVRFTPRDSSNDRNMILKPDGTWTWTGQPIQYGSDVRLKQQITEIDDKLLDAWEDVNLVQFKYNDAVEQKGKDKARLHTGFVVQQIDDACKKHGVDISTYGLYCHEEYPQEVEEVEVEQADGTKTKETKVIREASEHYSLRYTEALIVECKYLRRCIERLTARIEELEKGNNTK